MSRIFEKLRVPVDSVRTATMILVDGAKDISQKIKDSFAGGPMSELTEYVGLLKRFRERSSKKSRARYNDAKAFLSNKSKSSSQSNRHRRYD